MPTIEIISINSTGLGIHQSDFDLAIIEDNKPRSHRGLFYDLLQQQNGVIIHVGNPDLKDNKKSGFFAGRIIDWDFEPGDIVVPEVNSDNQTDNVGIHQQMKFKFIEKYKAEIDKLLKVALDKSPVKKVCFLTDYQYGLEKGGIEIISTISDFWAQHNSDGLHFNTLYEMDA